MTGLVTAGLDALAHGALLFDARVEAFVAPLRTPATDAFFTFVTRLGYWPVVVAVALGLTVHLLLSRQRRGAAVLWMVLVGNQISVELLKRTFARPRPPAPVFVEHGWSFPSGHAAVGVAFVGMVTWLVARRAGALRWPIIALGATLGLLIGVSRVWLRAHYASDVLAGWALGALWLGAGIWLTRNEPKMPAPPTGSRGRWRPALVLALTLALAGFALSKVDPVPAGSTRLQP